MKRTIVALLIAVIAAILCACGSATAEPANSEKAESEQSQPESLPEQAESVPEQEPEQEQATPLDAEKFVDELINNALNDSDAFAQMFVNMDTELVTNAATQLTAAHNDYEKRNVTVIAEQGDLAVLQINFYIVTGQFPDTHRSTQWFTYVLARQDNGKWCIDNSEETVAAADEIYSMNFPQDLVNATKNHVLFGNQMWLSDDVYEGCSNTEIVYAWEKEDGSVVVGLWIANGSDENITYTTCNIQLTSKEHGEILNVDDTFNKPVKSGNSKVLEVTVPAENVLVHEDWGEVNSHVNIHW